LESSVEIANYRINNVGGFTALKNGMVTGGTSAVLVGLVLVCFSFRGPPNRAYLSPPKFVGGYAPDVGSVVLVGGTPRSLVHRALGSTVTAGLGVADG